VGQQLQSAELLNSARQAARSLLSIGIINLAFGALNLYLLMTLFSGRKPLYLEATTASMLIAGALYVGMYYWAKFMPLAAAITGLCVYIAKWGVDFAIQNLQHSSVSNSSTSNYQWVRIIMVIYLFRGVAAGLRHRKLERDQRQAAPMPVLPVE
jgi:hypothetical protein